MNINLIIKRNKEICTAINRFRFICNHTSQGMDVNPCIYEDLCEVIEQINDLYAQCTMSENEYNEYTKNELEFDVFKESVKI